MDQDWSGVALEALATSLIGMTFLALLVAPANARDIILPWQETVQLEHKDRTARLKRLADKSLRASPRFYEERVPQSELPSSFRTNIPVLRVVFPQRVFFDTDQSDLRHEAEAVIDVVAEALRREASDTAVFIAGHTDDRGDDAYNYALSVRRAESVARALDRRGVRQASIWRVGFGEAIPLVPNSTDDAMARNRRVEFLFGRKAEAVGVWLSKQEAVVCASALAEQREECLKAFARLPRVEAAPVVTGSISRTLVQPPQSGAAVAVPTIESPRLVVVGPPVPPVSVGPEPLARTAVVVVPQERTVVTIAKDEPVIIDLRERRILVERLER